MSTHHLHILFLLLCYIFMFFFFLQILLRIRLDRLIGYPIAKHWSVTFVNLNLDHHWYYIIVVVVAKEFVPVVLPIGNQFRTEVGQTLFECATCVRTKTHDHITKCVVEVMKTRGTFLR